MNSLDFLAITKDIRARLETEEQIAVSEHWQSLILKLAYTNPQLLVGEFHKVMGLDICSDLINMRDEALERTLKQFRRDLIEEEYKELMIAWDSKDITEMYDALLDLIYVIYGTGISFGLDLPAGLAEVHRSNMTKLGSDGKPIRRKDGKILKPDTFQPVRLCDLLFIENTGIDYKEPFER